MRNMFLAASHLYTTERTQTHQNIDVRTRTPDSAFSIFVSMHLPLPHSKLYAISILTRIRRHARMVRIH